MTTAEKNLHIQEILLNPIAEELLIPSPWLISVSHLRFHLIMLRNQQSNSSNDFFKYWFQCLVLSIQFPSYEVVQKFLYLFNRWKIVPDVLAPTAPSIFSDYYLASPAHFSKFKCRISFQWWLSPKYKKYHLSVNKSK